MDDNKKNINTSNNIANENQEVRFGVLNQPRRKKIIRTPKEKQPISLEAVYKDNDKKNLELIRIIKEKEAEKLKDHNYAIDDKPTITPAISKQTKEDKITEPTLDKKIFIDQPSIEKITENDLDKVEEVISQEKPIIKSEEEAVDPVLDKKTIIEQPSVEMPDKNVLAKVDEFSKQKHVIKPEQMEIKKYHDFLGEKKKQAKLDNRRREKTIEKSTINRELFGLLVSLVIIFILFRFVFISIKVDGSSMQPTFENGENGLMLRTNVFNKPELFDVVVFKGKNNYNEDYLIIKRIIGMPNDIVEIKNNQIYVNNKLIDDSWRSPDTTLVDIKPFIVPSKKYFVLGDNRNNSRDSRSVGYISESDIIAAGGMIFWPLDNIKFFR